MWRLMNGELPTQHPPNVIVLHIGTNDLAGEQARAGFQSMRVFGRYPVEEGPCGTLPGLSFSTSGPPVIKRCMTSSSMFTTYQDQSPGRSALATSSVQMATQNAGARDQPA